MKKVLITGGAGFVGSSLADKLIDQGDYQITVVDNLLTGKEKNLQEPGPNYRFIKADANNWEEISPIVSSGNYNYIFHYAAIVGVERTLKYPVKVLEDIKGIENILILAKSTGVERVFFSSSSEVYGEPFEIPQHEDTTPLNSRLPYAIVKNVGEAYFRSFYEEYGLNYTIFRFFNTYGPKQNNDFVVSIFIDKAIKGEDIPIIGDGSQTRTFCYIDDNLEATIGCMKKGLHINDTINIGSDIEITIKELAELVIDVTNSKSKIKHLPARTEGDMKRRRPDSTKMSKILGKEFLPLRKGIEIIANERRI